MSDIPLVRVSIWRSLAIQRRVLGALLMREAITRFGRENIGVLWLMGEPMIFTLGIVALWTASGLAHGNELPVAAFAVTGYSSVLLWRSTVNRCNTAIEQNRQLLYHRNVRLFDVMLARCLLELAGITASFIILTSFFWVIEWVQPPQDLGKVIWGWLMLAWFGTALGSAIGALTGFSELVERLWHPMAYLLFPLSGAGFMVDWLSPKAQEVLLWLPMVHGVELLREGYFGSIVRTHYDLAYMAGVNSVLTLVALVLMRESAARLKQR